MARHGSLAEQLGGFRIFATSPDHEPESLQTTWAVHAANDNNPEDTEDLKHDRKRLVTPSVKEIMKNIVTGEIERNSSGQIVKIGRLKFSDGTQTEKAFRFTVDGKLEEYSARMTTGAMLGCRDKVDTALGGEINPQEITDSNNYFAAMLDTKKPRYVPGRRHKGPRVKLTHDEAKDDLAAAYANTDMTKVTFTRYPDGLPCGSQRVADSFLGMQKTTCAGGGSVMWQDIVSQREDRREWLEAKDGMAEDHFKTLTDAAKAGSLKQLGQARGYSGQYAIEAGRRLLVAANDNFEQALELARSAKSSK